MFFLRKLLSGTMPPAVTGFVEEDLLSTTAQGNGFFLTKPGAFLKAHRYEIIRKLGRGRCSNTFLVKDHEANEKYVAI
jgi:serine/threonine-protein kinase SRPK3